jgi:CRP-like cAMP-binding protein
VISTIEKVIFLKDVDLFKGISGEEVHHIATITEELEYPPDYSVVTEGESGHALYLIIAGQVQVHIKGQELALLGPKDCFGEMALLDEEPRSATVSALSELHVLRITQSDFFEILTEKPEISRGIIKTLTQRLRETNLKR